MMSCIDPESPPWFIACPNCNGEGMVESGRLIGSHWGFDPPFEPGMRCETCDGGGYVEGEHDPVEEWELDDRAPPVGETIERGAAP